MSENADDGIIQSEHIAQSVGEQLKAKREAISMSLEDVSSKTRITLHHLQAIEKSQYQKLPGKTYIIGFTKAYARAVNLNDAEIATQVRKELSQSDELVSHHHIETYEPAAAISIPSKALAWIAAIIAITALSAFIIWKMAQLDGSNDIINNDIIAEENETPADIDSNDASETNRNSTETIVAGKVIMTATGEVWLGIYDADKTRLYENTMQAGDSYEIPEDANGPQIVTGRPDLLTFTVGDKEIKPLGDGNKTLSYVGVSAEDLIAHHNSVDNDE